MRVLLAMAFSVCLVVKGAPVMALDVVKELGRPELSRAGKLLSGEASELSELRLRGPAIKGKEALIAVFPRPEVVEHHYALVGMARGNNLTVTGYLEMLSVFKNGTSYFSRSLAQRGPCAELDSGSWGWRPVLLPFLLSKDLCPEDLEQIELRWFLPGEGVVELRNFQLVQYQAGEDPLSALQLHTKPNLIMAYVAIVGSLLGLLGAVVGLLVALGVGRKTALLLMWCSVVVSGMLIVLGIYILSLGKSWLLYYPLLLLGVIAVSIFGSLLPVVNKRYSDHAS